VPPENKEQEQMQFAVLTRRKVDQFTDAQFAPILDAEAEHAREFYAEGFIRQIWMRGDMPGAFMMVEADSADDARHKLTTLPLHESGMLEIIAVVPLKPYRAFCPKK
jgi:muconolactone delta-isomerase